ncbi:MAG: sensor histidine kinase [Marinifilaceae bacterium]
MKLSILYRRYSLVTLSIVLLLGMLSDYMIFKYVIYDSADHTLIEFRDNIELHLRQHDTLVLADNPHLTSSIITARLLPPTSTREISFFKDTLIFNPYKNEKVVYRLHTFNIKNNSGDKNYLISLAQSTVDTEELIFASIISLISILLLYIIVSVIINKWFVRVLWRPFYTLLRQMSSIDLTYVQLLTPVKTRINEFNELYVTVNRMLVRIENDYMAMKEFTENAAHEVQTPLAVAKGKIEMLYDDKLTPDERHEILTGINKAIDKVTRLNRSILLMAKIQNDLFTGKTPIDLMAQLTQQLAALEDLIELKQLDIKIDGNAFDIDINPTLSELLISNILTNAIKYNIKGGYIHIENKGNKIQISNPYYNQIPDTDLFQRFTRSTDLKEATGLGLAIVKSICNKTDLHVSTNITTKVFTLIISK